MYVNHVYSPPLPVLFSNRNQEKCLSSFFNTLQNLFTPKNLIPESLSIQILELSLVPSSGSQIDQTSKAYVFPSPNPAVVPTTDSFIPLNYEFSEFSNPELNSVLSSGSHIDQTSKTQVFPSPEPAFVPAADSFIPLNSAFSEFLNPELSSVLSSGIHID